MDDIDDTHCFAPPPGFFKPSAPPVPMPPGKHDADFVKDIAQENTHVAINALTHVAANGKESGSARVAAANSILGVAGISTKANTDVQINIQQNFTSAQDDEILARYMAKKGVVVDG